MLENAPADESRGVGGERSGPAAKSFTGTPLSMTVIQSRSLWYMLRKLLLK